MPPKSALRQNGRTATPARSTRGSTAALEATPATRRTTRAASRQPTVARDIVSNPALPEIQTQQSYAYGSSKTPALPEQLHAPRDMSMRAVANRLADAADEAKRNFEAHAAEVRGGTPESQSSARDARAHKRASKEPSGKPSTMPDPSETPENVRKHDRIAAWVDSSQLEDIPEEDSRHHSLDQQPQTPDRGESEPSSFPTGSFDHSYNYERGIRGPNLPHPEPEPEYAPRPRPQHAPRPQAQAQRPPEPTVGRQPEHALAARVQPVATHLLTRARTRTRHVYLARVAQIQRIFQASCHWLAKIVRTMQKAIHDIPDSPAASALFKSLLMISLISICGLTFCTLFTYTCNPISTSIVSQSLQRLCGQCTSTTLDGAQLNLTMTSSRDLNALLAALQQVQSQISRIESLVNSQSSDTTALRLHQAALESQIHQLSQQQQQQHTNHPSLAIPNPLLPRINFFSPSSGAVIIPHLTSPTLTQKYSFPYHLALRLVGVKKTLSPPPITALEPWLDEGDCWCAAEVSMATADTSHNKPQASQDYARLGVQLPSPIYPTELVIEHFPATGSLNPGIAPKEIELWADFSSLSATEWTKLHIEDIVSQSPDQGFLPVYGRGGSWGRIGKARYVIDAAERSTPGPGKTYEMNAGEAFGRQQRIRKENPKARDVVNHMQRFSLEVNQHGELHYSDRFLVRVRSNHGAGHTCLYRVRLHGVPFEETVKRDTE